MGKNKFSLVANSVVELNVPEHILAQRMQRVGNHVKGFEMVKNGLYKYEFSSPYKFYYHENLAAQRIYLTSGSIVPVDENRCRLAVNTDSRIIVLLFPFIAFIASSFYYAFLEKDFSMDWELMVPLSGSLVLVLLMLLYAGFTNQKFHDKIISLAERIEKQYKAAPPFIK